MKGATLIGSCLDIIQNIDAVGDDLDFGPGICGKGQNAEVTAGSRPCGSAASTWAARGAR